MKWTNLQLRRLENLKEVLADLVKYKPLTLRQIYYQLVSREYIENTRSSYITLSKLVKWARIDGHISWDDIEDRGRVFYDLSGWEDKDSFLDYALGIFDSYRRDLWQTQENYVEVWIEKNALSSIFTRVCSRLGVSVVASRGFSSVSFLHDFKARIDNIGKPTVMIYFGDFDPSGMEIFRAMERSFDQLGISNITAKRIALLKDDISTYKLPHNPDALKKSDTRAMQHVCEYGNLAVELDALSPDILEEKVFHAVQSEIDDIAAFQSELSIYETELAELSELKSKVLNL